MKERIAVQTSMLGIAKKAKSDKRYRFRNLYRELNEELLLDSWRLLRKDAALGVDRVSAAEYEANLEENIKQLVERLKRKRYRAKLVRRHYIPKGNGGLRPLGIPATEDKLLQLAVSACWKQSTSRTFGHAVMAIDRWWERAQQWMNKE